MFRFRLESLLRLRKSRRDECCGELAQALEAEDLLRQRRETLAGEVESLRRQRAVEKGPVQIDELLETARYEFLLSSQQKLLEEQSVQVADEVQRRRAALTAADQQVRMLQKLKSTQHERHRADQERLEQKHIDELALLLRQLGPVE